MDVFNLETQWQKYLNSRPVRRFVARRYGNLKSAGSFVARQYGNLKSAGSFVARQCRAKGNHLRNLSKLPFEGQISYIRQMAAKRAARIEAGRRSAPQPQLSADLASFFPAIVRARQKYRPRPYAGRLVLFLASETPARRNGRARRAWRKLALGGADMYAVPGTHHEILYEPCVRVLAKHFKAHLEEAQRAACSPGR
jgi:hypothetical protein